MPRIVCPLCRLDLERQPKVWSCANRHSFDVSREGYVNLLPVQQKHSAEPGDSAAMLAARRDFLGAGHYAPLREAVLQLLAPLRAQGLADIGCGEGYYTAAFSAVAADVVGVDIARPAIQMAAKRFRDVTWLVASGAALPLADASVDLVSNLFTQLHVAEMQRVLAARGHALVVTPAADHLWEVREHLFDEVQAHVPGKFIAGFEPQFELCERREVRFGLQLTQQALRQLLLMTPYVWKARPEKRAALETQESFATAAAFALLLFRKRS